jgi:hypothetical protein
MHTLGFPKIINVQFTNNSAILYGFDVATTPSMIINIDQTTYSNVLASVKSIQEEKFEKH